MTIVPLPYLIHQIESQVSHDWIGLLLSFSSVRAARDDCVAEERRRRHHPPALPRLCAAAPGEPVLHGQFSIYLSPLEFLSQLP